MWRIQGFIGRVLHRCHGNTQLRLQQNHNVQDEVLNPSSLLSTSRHTSDFSFQADGHGEQRKKQRTFRFGHSQLPRYTALDAVGWGAAAVLFMQLCKRIHSQLSSGVEPGTNPGGLTCSTSLHRCGYRLLLEILSRRDVLARGSNVLCLQAVSESPSPEKSSAQSSSSSSVDTQLETSNENHLAADCTTSDQQRGVLSHEFFIPDDSFLSESFPLENDANESSTERNDASVEDVLSDDERLRQSTVNFKSVGDSSVPVVLNIFGLESCKSGNYEDAFLCFAAAAKQGYNKAQFNAGVCYEKGRGVQKDKEKALNYYWLAAAGGHKEAQYRHAKLLLTNREHQSPENLNTAIGLLEQSAAAGLTKAQVCLASVYSQEQVRNASKAVHYLKMAAESGDGTALLFLGQCFESGFGVQQNMGKAFEYYKQAAQAGNQQAKSLLTLQSDLHSKVEEAMLRSIHSSPCFSGADHRLQRPLSALVSGVPHSWSTGSLFVPSTLSFTPPHLHPHSGEDATCLWTVGMG